MPFYRGRVKCIFIDPPYNTKSAFEHYDESRAQPVAVDDGSRRRSANETRRIGVGDVCSYFDHESFSDTAKLNTGIPAE